MKDTVKASITIMAALVVCGMIGVACYGFLNGAKDWGGLMIAGMMAGGLTMCAAYNA